MDNIHFIVTWVMTDIELLSFTELTKKLKTYIYNFQSGLQFKKF
ncbi:MAG: hypothetical protein PHV93_04610 [Candidatus Pacebacteria bacterium]|nr:hypothetical protein [Candidatus Paceibacterota bacterium]